MLLAKNLHIENIFKFFILYGAAYFCTTSTLMKDFIEGLQKGENSLVGKFEIMEHDCQPCSRHIVRFALGKAIKVANLLGCFPSPGESSEGGQPLRMLSQPWSMSTESWLVERKVLLDCATPTSATKVLWTPS